MRSLLVSGVEGRRFGAVRDVISFDHDESLLPGYKQAFYNTYPKVHFIGFSIFTAIV